MNMNTDYYNKHVFDDNYNLTEIAGEKFAMASRRNDLLSEAARLKEALGIAKRALRWSHVLYMGFEA
jgi:hypothetical protein